MHLAQGRVAYVKHLWVEIQHGPRKVTQEQVGLQSTLLYTPFTTSHYSDNERKLPPRYSDEEKELIFRNR